MMDLLKSQLSVPHCALVITKSGGHMLAAFLWLKKTTSPAGGYDYIFCFYGSKAISTNCSAHMVRMVAGSPV